MFVGWYSINFRMCFESHLVWCWCCWCDWVTAVNRWVSCWCWCDCCWCDWVTDVNRWVSCWYWWWWRDSHWSWLKTFWQWHPLWDWLLQMSCAKLSTALSLLSGVWDTQTDLFSLCSWCRNLHIWSPNYTSMLALHKLHKWLRFGYTIAISVIRSSFLMRSYFWHGRCVQKVHEPAYDMHISSLAIAVLVLVQT